MANKKLIGGFIAIFLIAGVAGGFIGYYFPRLDFGSFNPTIDGNFESSDGWRFANWQFTEYLLTDVNSSDAYNYYYIHLTENFLYILVDLVSDITNETDKEWISIWIDTDNNQENFYPAFNTWNDDISDSGEEMLFYIPKTDSFNKTLTYGGIDFNSTLNSSDVSIKYGFQKTINSQLAHRVFEVQILRTSLENFNITNFNIAFFGYGTLAAITSTDSWGAPSSFATIFYMDRIIYENSYYKCGYGEDIWDINSKPK